MEQLTLLSEEHHVNHSRLPDFAEGLKTLEETSCLPLVQLLKSIALPGYYGKMSPASCQVTEEGILEPFSQCWGNSGMGMPTEFLTLNTSEWHRDAEECLLSDTLEIGEIQPKYHLSKKACEGILRRAKKRNKELPKTLVMALKQVAKD